MKLVYKTSCIYNYFSNYWITDRHWALNPTSHYLYGGDPSPKLLSARIIKLSSVNLKDV